jgi:hypothetical protein
MGMLRAFAAFCILGSGGLPWCWAIVPAESQVISFSKDLSFNSLRNVASAAGDLQIFPQQTNTICMLNLLQPMRL